MMVCKRAKGIKGGVGENWSNREGGVVDRGDIEKVENWNNESARCHILKIGGNGKGTYWYKRSCSSADLG